MTGGRMLASSNIKLSQALFVLAFMVMLSACKVDNTLQGTIGSSAPIVNFQISSSNADENVGTKDIVLTMNTTASINVVVTVVASGSATIGAPNDYTLSATTITFSPNETSKTITVSVNDDALNEAAETVMLNIDTVTGGNATEGSTGQHTFTINANDAITSQFAVTGPATGTSGFCYAYTVERQDILGNPLNVTADTTINLSGGAAKFYAGLNCSGAASTSVTMTNGSSSKVFYVRNPSAESYTITAGDSVGADGTKAVTLSAITASLVLGQPDFVTHKGMHKGLNSNAYYLHSDGTRLFAADCGGHRVLIWNSIPTVTHQSPDLVLGQPDFASNTVNNGGVSNKSLSCPVGIYSTGTKLYVADNNNHRVLIWNAIPTANFTSADVVIGQPNFTSNSANQGGAVSAQTLSGPWTMIEKNSKLFVLDHGNRRVLIYNTLPATNNPTADVVVGQPDMLTSTINHPAGTPTSQSIGDQPRGLHVEGTKLFVADYLNHRILIYNTIPTANYPAADLVLGQPNFTSNTPNNGGISAQTLYRANSVHSDGTRLLVADYTNGRVLIWNTLPTVNQQAADVVLGQPNFTSSTYNNGGIGADTFYRPYYAMSDGTRVFAADHENIRFLQWNSIPTVNKTPADIVLGQHNFTSTALTNGGVDGLTFAASGGGPRGIHVDAVSNKLFLADYLNWRVLIWNALPTISNTLPDVVLCQPDMTTAVDPGAGAATASNSRKSNGVFTSGTRLYEADHSFSRILVWNTIPTVNNTAGDFALGQVNLTTGTEGASPTASTLKRPHSVHEDGTRLFVADSENHRALIWNVIPNASGAAASVVLGQSVMTTRNTNDGGLSASSLSLPLAVHSNGTKLTVSDIGNSRVLIWNTIPTVNFTPADVVVGQPDFTTNTANTGGISASSLNGGSEALFSGSRLIVADIGNNRILIWMNIPTANSQPADVVIGQPDMFSSAINNGGLSAKSLWGVRRLSINGNDLWVTDANNARILKFTIPSF